MPIFSIRQGELERIKEVDFKNEKEIQKITESNLKKIFSLELVKSELPLGNLRIDTLAFDEEETSFLIIEYKKDKNFSVIDQGFAYLALLLNNKADFILEYNENKDGILKKGDVDWSQSKIIFISPKFTKYQKLAIDFKDLPIELWEITNYENNSILFNKLEAPESRESITVVGKESETVKKVSREIKVYTEEVHIQNMPDEIKELYEVLKERILNLGENIEIRPRKFYIGFIASSNFVDIHLQRSQIKLWINLSKGNLDDSRKIAKDVSDIGHWGNGDYEITLKPEDDLYVLVTSCVDSLPSCKMVLLYYAITSSSTISSNTDFR